MKSVTCPARAPMRRFVAVDGREYRRLDDGQYVPRYVYDQVRDHLGVEPMPSRGEAVYHRYVEQRFLPPLYRGARVYCGVPGGAVSAGTLPGPQRGPLPVEYFRIGHWPAAARANVYSSAKQVTDFVFTEREIQYTRVVAVEYPRKGMWSVGLVTGESLPQFRDLMHEPLLAVTLPCSPAPMAARSITVPKRDVVDLNMTVDQALQFIMSCGVVIPHQSQNRQDEGRSTK